MQSTPPWWLPWLPTLTSVGIFVVLPLLLWIFRPRLVTREEMEDALRGERDARRELDETLAKLERDHAVLTERLRHLPTQDGLNLVVNRLERLTGMLEGKLADLTRLETAVARHDDIIADAARASAARNGGH